MSTEDDLSASVTETDRMRELQDKVASLRAQVSAFYCINWELFGEGLSLIMQSAVFRSHAFFFSNTFFHEKTSEATLHNWHMFCLSSH